MNNIDLIKRLALLDPMLPVTGADGNDVVSAEKSSYTDEEGEHDCIVIEMMEF